MGSPRVTMLLHPWFLVKFCSSCSITLSAFVLFFFPNFFHLFSCSSCLIVSIPYVITITLYFWDLGKMWNSLKFWVKLCGCLNFPGTLLSVLSRLVEQIACVLCSVPVCICRLSCSWHHMIYIAVHTLCIRTTLYWAHDLDMFLTVGTLIYSVTISQPYDDSGWEIKWIHIELSNFIVIQTIYQR